MDEVITDWGSDGYDHPRMDPQPDPEELKLRNGAAWYVVILPILGLFLENYAINIWLGAMVWIFVLVGSPLVCFLEAKKLAELGYAPQSLKAAAVIPPVYMFKRCNVLRQPSTKGVLLTIFAFLALAGNGFTHAYYMDESSFTQYVEDNYVVYLEEFAEESSISTIGQQLEAYCTGEPEYSLEENDKEKTVTVSAQCEKGSLELVFKYSFDGYAFSELRIASVSLNGRELEGGDKDELLCEIFIETEADLSNA